jgi:hypothetical protein
MTAGAFPSFDFDLVVTADDVFEAILFAHGFKREVRAGKLRFAITTPTTWRSAGNLSPARSSTAGRTKLAPSGSR